MSQNCADGGSSDMVNIEDQQQKTCLGGDLWALKNQDYFTDLVLVGSDSKKVKGHLCVIAVASPLVKNHAVDSSLQKLDGKVVIPVPNFHSAVIEHFVSFAYRGQVSIPADSVRDLYNLADYFMDVSLQAAITNTVGSVPANIPNIADVLKKNDPMKEVVLDEKEEEEWLAAMAKKTPGRRKGRPPKKNNFRQKDSLSTPTTLPVVITPSSSATVKTNGTATAATPGSSTPGSSTSAQVTRIKRKSAVDATQKWKKATGNMVAETDEREEGEEVDDDLDELPEVDDDYDDDDDDPPAGTTNKPFPSVSPRRRLLKRKAKTQGQRGRRKATSTTGGRGQYGRRPKEENTELEWVDGKPTTICKQCNLTICVHRVTIIAPEELEYHIREEGGMVVDPGEAVQQGIDALLSMAAGEGGLRPEGERVPEAEGGGGEDGEKEEGKNPKTENDEDADVKDNSLTEPSRNLQISPLRAKYKLWVDPLTKKTKKLYPCDHCGNLYLSLARLIRHMPSHTGVFPFQCPLCTATFKTKDELTKHDRRRHCSTASSGFPGGEFQCPQCAISYNTQDSLTKHISNHNNDTRQPKANYVLKRKPESNRLVRTYPCAHCSAEFNKASEYEGHLATHTGIKLYHCRLCNKRFGMEGYLKKHMLRHVEEKSYICALCGAAFKTSSGLYTHEHSVHIENKPFVCEVCGKEFKMKWSMKEHLRMTHSDYVLPKGQTSSWQCSLCGGYLPSEIMFKIHERLHITDKPFKCRLCSASFKYRAARLSHERREHEGVQQDPRLVMPRTPKPTRRNQQQEEQQPPPQQQQQLQMLQELLPTHDQQQQQQQQHQLQQHHHPLSPLSKSHHHLEQQHHHHRHHPHHFSSAPSTTASTSALVSQAVQYMDSLYYPAVPVPVTSTLSLPQAISHAQQAQQQQQQQQQQQPEHNHPLPPPSPSNPVPSAILVSPTPPPSSMPLPVVTMAYPPAHYITPSHTPTPSEAAAAAAAAVYHNNRVSTPSFSISSTPPQQAPPSSDLAPPPSVTAHVLPPAAAVLYDSSSYYMAAAATSHLCPPPPLPPAVTTPSSLPPPPTPATSSQEQHRSTPNPPPPPHHQSVPSICSICNLTFENQPQLWNHMAVVHNVM